MGVHFLFMVIRSIAKHLCTIYTNLLCTLRYMQSDFAVCFTIYLYTVTRDCNHREIDNNKEQHLQHIIINDGDLILPLIRN